MLQYNRDGKAAVREESGFAMIVVLILITICSLLAVTLLAQGEHLDRATFRDRKWHTALQVAESGVDRTIARLNNGEYATFAGFTTAQTAPDGQYETQVTDVATSGLGRKAITATSYIPSKGHRNELRRRIRVVLGPPPTIKYALFGAKCVTVANAGSPVVGDVFSNGHVTVENNTLVNGDVTSSRGVVQLAPNAEIRKNGIRGGTVRSGGVPADEACTGITSGFAGIKMANNSVIERSARAQRPECTSTPGGPTSRYGIDGTPGARILGDAVAWGSIDAAVTVSGTRISPSCEIAAAPVDLPAYAAYSTIPPVGYNLAFYDSIAPSVTPRKIYSTTGAFLTYMNSNRTNLRGIHLIEQTSANAAVTIDMSGTTIRDHFVLVSPGPITRGNSLSLVDFFSSTSPDKKTVQIVSLQPPSSPLPTPPGITFDDNSFTYTGEPCVLFYSTGTVVLKNNATIFGAVYGNIVEIKNGFQIKYDKCIENSLAFGDELVSERNFFDEMTP